MYKKPVIVFEGIEGSGKTLHSRFLSNYLKKKKIKFIKFREPGGCSSSEKIRKLILDNKSNFHKITDLFLYFASRNENLEKIIKNNYGKKLILIDRFFDSTIAYQHYGMGIDLKLINSLSSYFIKKINVDLTFLNLVNMTNLRMRLAKRKKLNRYDKFKLSFYRNVQNGYIKLYKKNKRRYRVIDSNLSISINKQKIIREVEKLLR